MKLTETTPAGASANIGLKSTAIAGRHTPLLRNFWYVAAIGTEITRTPMRRTILDEDIVFYRTEDGKAVAVQNRCPHRSFALHTGTVKGDRIVCGYHGIEYNPDGSCGHVPALNSAPKAFRLDAYPLVEDGPMVWIWMGDKANPDYSRMIYQDWCSEPGKWTYFTGYSYMKANYLGLHENLMDLSHFPFLHGKWNLARPEHAAAPSKIEEEGDVIRQYEDHEDIDLSPTYIEATGLKRPITRGNVHLVQSPAVHQGMQVTTDGSEPQQRHIWHIIHIMTPESQTTTHYFWAIARDKALDNEKITEEMAMVAEEAFLEDKIALEDIEELIARDRHRPGFSERIMRSDEGGIRVLRMFARIAAREHPEEMGAVAAE